MSQIPRDTKALAGRWLAGRCHSVCSFKSNVTAIW